MSSAKVLFSAEELRLVRDPAVILTKNSVMAKVVELMAAQSEGYRPVWEGAIARAVAADDAAKNREATDGLAAASRTGGLAGELMAASPKISKGENYRGLPWVMLDYPRFFGREDVFAIRTMFWWGHAFSTTLHLKGKYRELYLPVIEKHWAVLAEAGFRVGVSEDEWQHEHGDHNYGVLTGVEDLRRGQAGAAADPGGAPQAGGGAQNAGGAAHAGSSAHSRGVDPGGARNFLKLSAAVGLDRWEVVPDALTVMFKTLISVLF